RTGGQVDLGPDLYAPQAVLDPRRDRVLLWGWAREGGQRTQEQTDAQGWSGCLTFPRELSLVDDQLLASAPAELERLRGERLELPGRGADRTADLASPARAEIHSAGRLRVELLGAQGAGEVLVEHTGSAATVFLAGSCAPPEQPEPDPAADRCEGPQAAPAHLRPRCRDRGCRPRWSEAGPQAVRVRRSTHSWGPLTRYSTVTGPSYRSCAWARSGFGSCGATRSMANPGRIESNAPKTAACRTACEIARASMRGTSASWSFSVDDGVRLGKGRLCVIGTVNRIG